MCKGLDSNQMCDTFSFKEVSYREVQLYIYNRISGIVGGTIYMELYFHIDHLYI